MILDLRQRMLRSTVDDLSGARFLCQEYTQVEPDKHSIGGLVRAAKVTVKVTKEPLEKASGAGSTLPGSDRFGKFAARASHYLGSRWSFVAAIGVIVAW